MSPEVQAAIVGAASAALVGLGGTGLFQYLKHRREDRDAYEKALRDVLTRAVVFQMALQVFRAGWHGRRLPGTRGRLANDFHLLLPPMERITDALSVVTLSRARKHRLIVQAAGPLTDEVGALMEALNEDEDAYTARREAYNKALREFRREVDRRKDFWMPNPFRPAIRTGSPGRE
ncbi:hypothetical protein [Acrocarpospora catenulata]|uniref:hypothetical protein n=1 Tax=Acrocarpospora catenulata TaxID=2836182 RepID=UPI001BDB5045|nr:hypothetical protein [Acrocarpospora catenulata]